MSVYALLVPLQHWTQARIIQYHHHNKEVAP